MSVVSFNAARERREIEHQSEVREMEAEVATLRARIIVSVEGLQRRAGRDATLRLLRDLVKQMGE